MAEAAQRVPKGAMSITDAAVHAALKRLGKESLQGLLAEAAAGAATQGGQANGMKKCMTLGRVKCKCGWRAFFCG